MPELPEVETIVRGLDRRVAGDTVESVWIGSKRQPLKSPASVIARTLEGMRVARVHRAGKHIVFELEGKAHTAAQWIVHLGMTGRIVVCESAAEVVKHTHLIARLASGRELRFVDPRMFGKLSVVTGGFDPGGVEPLEVSEERFIALFRRRKTPIKSALLNQKLLRGVGNIYADESLFRAGIRPRRRASVITRAQFTVSPQTGGINSSGLYTAPASIASQTTVTVTATSVADGTKSASATVTLVPAAPVVYSVSAPNGVAVGNSVTINGANFGSSQGAVAFNGTPMTVVSWSATAIVAQVPAGATAGYITVVVSGFAPAASRRRSARASAGSR